MDSGDSSPAKDEWEKTWKAYQNRKTRNSNITSAKNQARKKYEPILRTLVATLTADPLVSDADLNSMGIVGRIKSGALIPVPTTYPETEIRLPVLAKIELHFRDTDETGPAKPHGVRSAEIRWAILGTPPTDWDELLHSEFDTQSPFTLTFKRKRFISPFAGKIPQGKRDRGRRYRVRLFRSIAP
ncbi:hypothetical protein Barb4_04736 [Bacteroidales bacterium Barb4]|nr:hypothetical protein Barb4_04736 [Bacteroidales bacterium Barb4]